MLLGAFSFSQPNTRPPGTKGRRGRLCVLFLYIKILKGDFEMAAITQIGEHLLQNYQTLATEKIAAELKTFTGGRKEKCISTHAAAQITHFCEESPAFAEVVYKTRRTLSDCCTEVLKGSQDYASDIDVYRGIVRAYFPNADVKFLMNIEINGDAPSEEEMAKVPEKPARPAVPAKPAKPAPAPDSKLPKPETIQLSLF